MNSLFKAFALVTFVISSLCLSTFSFANNLSITQVELKSRTPSSNSVVVEFDASWENSWRTKINHDAVWLTVRLYNPSLAPTDKRLCQISNSGLNPTGTSTGSASNLEIFVPSDKTGAFLRPSAFGKQDSISTSNIQLTIDFDSCGFTSSDAVMASVMGIEMVLIPEGAFYSGDYATSTAALVEGSADNDPWYIDDSESMSVNAATSNGYYYVSAGQTGEAGSGSSFSISEEFPNGFDAFYIMKYELTETQWVEFINSLPTQSARTTRDLTNSNHKNSDAVIKRNTISCSGNPLTCTTTRPSRAIGYLTWMDLAAFLDWAALRPITELEFEKAARGPVLPNEGEYAWGSSDLVAAAAISGALEDGTESVTTSGANAHYNNSVLSGGDSANGSEYTQGPLRTGIFAKSSSTRVSSGGSYYGVLELSGNLRERVVTIGNQTGRNFTGVHGDGVLSTTSGYEGNANQLVWPGTNINSEYGVTSADGTGYRGGGWSDSSTYLRISDRSVAAKAETTASENSGGRGVRTYEE